MMIPASAPFALKHRGTPEFATPDDQSVFEQATLFEIGQESRWDGRSGHNKSSCSWPGHHDDPIRGDTSERSAPHAPPTGEQEDNWKRSYRHLVWLRRAQGQKEVRPKRPSIQETLDCMRKAIS